METSLRAPLIVSCRKRRGLERLEAAVLAGYVETKTL